MWVEMRREGAVAIVTMDRPERRNALSEAMAGELGDTLDAAGRMGSVRAVVIAGSRGVFSVGADLKERADLPAGRWEEHHRAFERLARTLWALPQPAIAAVDGWALGGGSEIALGCDIVVASPRALFGQPEVKRGLIPGMGGSGLLSHRLPAGMAAYLLFSGAALGAEEAWRLGLVTFLDADPRARALAIARDIAEASPVAVRAVKRVMRLTRPPLEEAYRLELRAWRDVLASGHPLEGARAFVERRRPVFPDDPET